MDYITLDSVYWRKTRSKANCTFGETVLSIFYEKKISDYLYLTSFYLIILVFLVVVVVTAEVFLSFGGNSCYQWFWFSYFRVSMITFSWALKMILSESEGESLRLIFLFKFCFLEALK